MSNHSSLFTPLISSLKEDALEMAPGVISLVLVVMSFKLAIKFLKDASFNSSRKKYDNGDTLNMTISEKRRFKRRYNSVTRVDFKK